MYAKFIKATQDLLANKAAVKKDINDNVRKASGHSLNKIFEENKLETNKIGLAALRDVFKKVIENTNDDKKIADLAKKTQALLLEIIDKPDTLAKNITDIRKNLPDDKEETVRKNLKYTKELINTQKKAREDRNERRQTETIQITLNDVYSYLKHFRAQYLNDSLTPIQRHINLLLFCVLNTGSRPTECLFANYEAKGRDKVKISGIFKQKDDGRELVEPIRPLLLQDSAKETVNYIQKTLWEFFDEQYDIDIEGEGEIKRINNLIQRSMNDQVRKILPTSTAYSLRKIYVATAFKLYAKKGEKENAFIKKTLGHESLDTANDYQVYAIVDDTVIESKIAGEPIKITESQLKQEVHEEIKKYIKEELEKLPWKGKRQLEFFELEKKWFSETGKYLPKKLIDKYNFNHKTVSAVRKIVNKDKAKWYGPVVASSEEEK